MPCDRHNWRALLVPVALIALLSTAGCLRSTSLRSPVEPVLEPQSRGEPEPNENERLILPPDLETKPSQPMAATKRQAEKPDLPSQESALDPAAAAIAAPASSSAAHVGQALLADISRESSAPGQDTPAAPSQAASALSVATATPPDSPPTSSSGTSKHLPAGDSISVSSPAPSSTPLLDAAIQRVEAVARQQRESSSAEDVSDESDHKPVTAPKSDASKSAGTAKLTEAPALFPISLARMEEEREPGAGVKHGQSSLLAARSGAPRNRMGLAPKAGLPDHGRGPNGSSEWTNHRDETEHAPGAPGSTEPAPEAGEPLGVANLQLCRAVSGFASFEPWGEPAVRAGQRVLLYCEMTGLRYEAAGSGFASRLKSRVEVRKAGDEAIIWDQELGIAQDECSRARHDYYVCYCFKLPESLPPGKHRLRMVQTDLANDKSANAEIELTIVR